MKASVAQRFHFDRQFGRREAEDDGRQNPHEDLNIKLPKDAHSPPPVRARTLPGRGRGNQSPRLRLDRATHLA